MKCDKNRCRKYKKAQVGPTITWIAAFIIILFIMMMFLVASIGLSKIKKLGTKDFKLSVEKGSGERALEIDIMLSLLNVPISAAGKEMSFKEAVIKWSFDRKSYVHEIITGSSELIKSYNPQCYVFRIQPAEEPEKNIEIMNIANAPFPGAESAYKPESLFINGNGLIEISLYMGEC